jgi:sugar phosphate isomerase/epimerase
MQLAFIAQNDLQGLESDCRFAVRHNIHYLEFNFWDEFSRINREYVKSIRGLLDSYGLGCASLGIWGYNHISADTSIRREAQYQRERAIEFAQLLGARSFVTGGGQISDVLDENVYTFANVMRPHIDAVHTAGMNFAVYGFHGGFLTNLEAYDRLWSVVGDVGMKYDPANILQAGYDYLDVVRRQGRRIQHVHIKEVLFHQGERISEPPAGMGDIRWGPLMALLYEADYRGILSIEPHGHFWTRPGQRERMILLSRQYLLPFLYA